MNSRDSRQFFYACWAQREKNVCPQSSILPKLTLGSSLTNSVCSTFTQWTFFCISNIRFFLKFSRELEASSTSLMESMDSDLITLFSFYRSFLSSVDLLSRKPLAFILGSLLLHDVKNYHRCPTQVKTNCTKSHANCLGLLRLHKKIPQTGYLKQYIYNLLQFQRLGSPRSSCQLIDFQLAYYCLLIMSSHGVSSLSVGTQRGKQLSLFPFLKRPPVTS